jgi:hypothetical protein
VEAAVATREAGDERPVLIMAQDEGCFGRINRAKRCWAPPGVRPHVPAQVVREYIYAYTAVAPALGQMVSLILPEASTAMMNLLTFAGQPDLLEAFHRYASRSSRLA